MISGRRSRLHALPLENTRGICFGALRNLLVRRLKGCTEQGEIRQKISADMTDCRFEGGEHFIHGKADISGPCVICLLAPQLADSLLWDFTL